MSEIWGSIVWFQVECLIFDLQGSVKRGTTWEMLKSQWVQVGMMKEIWGSIVWLLVLDYWWRRKEAAVFFTRRKKNESGRGIEWPRVLENLGELNRAGYFRSSKISGRERGARFSRVDALFENFGKNISGTKKLKDDIFFLQTTYKIKCLPRVNSVFWFMTLADDIQLCMSSNLKNPTIDDILLRQTLYVCHPTCVCHCSYVIYAHFSSSVRWTFVHR